MTHTYVRLGVSKRTWDEIAERLSDADYKRVFTDDGLIDMNGLALEKLDYVPGPQGYPRLPDSRMQG